MLARCARRQLLRRDFSNGKVCENLLRPTRYIPVASQAKDERGDCLRYPIGLNLLFHPTRGRPCFSQVSVTMGLLELLIRVRGSFPGKSLPEGP